MPRPTVLAYYFPNWHRDPRNAAWFGDDWDEWQLLRAARPRFEGHRQPRVPALGYFDEATPHVAAQQIDLAREHGIDGFLVDYYWYEDGPFLSDALDDGLLKAHNRADITFAIMWANHEYVDIFPHPSPHVASTRRLASGTIDRPTFERMGRHIVQAYFSQPNYLKVDGRPWFSVYELGSLILGLGGVAETLAALQWFEALAIEAGHPGIHFDAVIWGVGLLPEAITLESPQELIATLGFASATSYVWVHHADPADFDFPLADLGELRRAAFEDYERFAESLPVPFHPNVTVGWDASPRTAQAVDFERGDYPWMPVWDADPVEFAEGLRVAREFIDRHDTEHPVLTINAWNEWTEGSSLLPDQDHGMAFLEAIRDVFGTAVDSVAPGEYVPS